jgi:hypothetical protein
MSNDRGLGQDHVGVGVSAPLEEHGRWVGIYRIERFDAPIEWYAQRVADEQFTLADAELVRRAERWDQIPAAVQLATQERFRKQVHVYAESEFHNNLLPSGVNAMLTVICSTTAPTTNSGASPAGATAGFTLAQARLAIGDSSTAFANTQTWLVAATNKYSQTQDASFPAVSTVSNVAQVQFKATVTGTNANFAWNEFCADNAGGSNSTTGASATLSGGSVLNRAVSAQGTKTSGQTWALTLTIQIS